MQLNNNYWSFSPLNWLQGSLDATHVILSIGVKACRSERRGFEHTEVQPPRRACDIDFTLSVTFCATYPAPPRPPPSNLEKQKPKKLNVVPARTKAAIRLLLHPAWPHPTSRNKNLTNPSWFRQEQEWRSALDKIPAYGVER